MNFNWGQRHSNKTSGTYFSPMVALLGNQILRNGEWVPRITLTRGFNQTNQYVLSFYLFVPVLSRMFSPNLCASFPLTIHCLRTGTPLSQSQSLLVLFYSIIYQYCHHCLLTDNLFKKPAPHEDLSCPAAPPESVVMPHTYLVQHLYGNTQELISTS